MKTAVILLAGGNGTRFGGPIPKQFLKIANQHVIQYSIDALKTIPSVVELVVVCAEEYRHYFPSSVSFASPGVRRQDSVYNGLMAVKKEVDFICIHDGARPCVTYEITNRVLDAAYEYGAATAGMPLKFTIKERNEAHFVTRTPDRNYLWEIQTPQAMRYDWLVQGFEKVRKENLTVTDDVSIVEQLGHPIKLVEGSYENIKITTTEDMILATHILDAVYV